MNNQDQFNEVESTRQSPDRREVTTTRRTITAILVLIASLLLGYVIYDMMFMTEPASNEIIAPAQPEQNAEETALFRLQAVEQESIDSPSEAMIERLIEEPDMLPTQEQLDRLSQFDTES